MLVFCDCGFHSVYPLMEKDKRLMEASWWERLTEGEAGSCSDGQGHAHTAALSAPDPAAGHRWSTPPPETPVHSQASLGQSLVGSLILSPGSWCTQGSVCTLQESVSPVPCKFWQLYGGVNGDLLQGGLCHIQVCCTQSPCPCSRPLLTCTSLGDTQTQFWLSLLCGVSGSMGPGAHKVCLSPLSISGT